VTIEEINANAIDSFIENFLEHKVYDPDKAHEYYMRTRKLKGRKPAASKTPSYTAKHKQMDAALRKLGEGAKNRAKTMSKLTSSQLATAKKWIDTAEKYESVYKTSGMARKEDAIMYSDDLTDAQKDSALHTLYKNPAYNKLDKARDTMFKTFLAKPEIIRYYEIQDTQDKMKNNAAKAAMKALQLKAKLDGRPRSGGL
jgi:hypothetical protein